MDLSSKVFLVYLYYNIKNFYKIYGYTIKTLASFDSWKVETREIKHRIKIEENKE